jgi:predicted nucleotidyltransferase
MNIKKTIKSHLPHSQLSKKIWIGKEMLPEFREALLKIANAFIDYLGVSIDVADITMTGSYANYNYTVFSDIDLHILVDMKSFDADGDLVKEFFNAKKSFWNNRHDIELKDIEVELYPQDTNEPHTSSGVYSVFDDKWLVKPKKFKSGIDISNIEKGAKKVVKEINSILKDSIKNASTDDIVKMIKKLKKMRSSGLEKAGELADENIIYKVLRSQGLLQKLFDTMNDIEDESLSSL